MNDINPKKKRNTSQLLNYIKKSDSFADIAKVLNSNVEKEEVTFCHYLYKVMETHQASAKDVIVKCGIERSYFYHILSGKKIPARNIILRIALSIPAALEETNQLLRLAEQGTLYAKVRRDAVIIYCIDKKYTLQQTNELLKEYQEQPLYREDQ